MRIEKRLMLALFPLMLACTLCATAARAQSELLSTEDFMRAVVVLIFGEDFPSYWITYSGFMQFIVLPFVAVFAVIYGIFSEIKIFRQKSVKLALSLVMALVGGYLTLSVMRTFLIVNGFFGVVAFGVLMLIGVILLGLGWVVKNAPRSLPISRRP